MANVQKQISQYDDAIRLTRFDENATLREKRDAVLNKLRVRFAEMRKQGKEVPFFRHFDQGSYKMGTGIDPANGDYDIDVGLDFNVAKSKYDDPVDLKVLVCEALTDHTPLGTDIRRSCVTVKYQVAGEQAYHVDLAVYACDNPDVEPRSLHLAKGKRHSELAHRFWEPSDPKGLMTWVENHYPNEPEKEQQFLRVIRMLKGWKSYRFDHNGNGAPAGIGLTIAAGQMFNPLLTIDPISRKVTFDDLGAMRALANRMLASFSWVASEETPGALVERLVVKVPVAPWKDVFLRMKDTQMVTFKERLTKLRDVLDEVAREEDPVVACTKMQREFGDRFPVPAKEDTAQPRKAAITSSGVSA